MRDPNFQTDVLASGLLEFPSGHCVFTCGTQMVPNQRMKFLGTTGRIEFDIPFNAIPDGSRASASTTAAIFRGSGVTVEEFAPCDQYTLQGDRFSRAILAHTPPPVPLEDARYQQVIEALFRAAESGTVELR